MTRKRGTAVAAAAAGIHTAVDGHADSISARGSPDEQRLRLAPRRAPAPAGCKPLGVNGLEQPGTPHSADAERDQRLEALLAGCARGSRAAFADLYRATSAVLFAVAIRLLKRSDRAEEVLHDCYLSIWNNAGAYSRTLSAPMTWMIAIVRNRCLDHLRRPVVEMTLLPDEDGEDPLEEVASDAPSALERLCAAADAQSVARCLTRLTPEQRQAIALAFYEGLSRVELAERLGRPVGTVKTWIRRGLEQLRACLEGA